MEAEWNIESPSSFQMADAVLPSSIQDNGIWKVFLPAGGTITDRDFGLRPASTSGQFENAAINGRLFVDQGSKPGIAGETLFLDLNENGARDFNEPRTVSAIDDPSTDDVDEAGQYSFSSLGNRPYTVRVLDASHLLQTTPVGNSFDRQVYSLAVTGSQLGSPQDVIVADFNGDTWPDLATAIYDRNSVSILLNDGHGGYTLPLIEIPLAPASRPTSSPRGVGPVALLAGDFNGVGGLDLAVVNSFSFNVAILLDFDGQHFASENYVNVGVLPNSIASGYLDDDNDLDLIVTNDLANASGTVKNVSILRNNGQGTFTADAAPPVAGNNPSAVVTGYFNADTLLDLAITDFGTNPKEPIWAMFACCCRMPMGLSSRALRAAWASVRPHW